MNFSLILAVKLTKKKDLWKFWELKIKIWHTFSTYLLFILINTLFLFVLNKQVKAEVRKQPFKCVPREKIKK